MTDSVIKAEQAGEGTPLPRVSQGQSIHGFIWGLVEAQRKF